MVDKALSSVTKLCWKVLLANKLDDDISLSYIGVVSPLFISYCTLILMSFGAKGGNRWWFGIRKDFCHFLLSLCPFLQEYANIAYSLQNDDRAQARSQIANDHSGNIGTSDSKPEKIVKKTELLKPVVPVISIDMPD